MIVSIRGTNGSGKSTAARQLMALGSVRPLYGILGPARPEASELRLPDVELPAYVLGSYQTPTGGCDTIQPYGSILELVRKYASRGHVVLEGMLVSDTWGRLGTLLEEWGQDAVLAFLDTPLEVCLERVGQRRLARSDGRELDPGNTTARYERIRGIREKALASGRVRVVDLSADTAVADLHRLLAEDG